ncbi:MAG: hypothetical protein ACK4SA_19785, partial [Caldilinea sp.]
STFFLSAQDDSYYWCIGTPTLPYIDSIEESTRPVVSASDSLSIANALPNWAAHLLIDVQLLVH